MGKYPEKIPQNFRKGMIIFMSKLIYIADDDQSIRNLIEMFLKSEGHGVETFENGDKLYEAFNKNEADLVILDVMMPGNDGFTICNMIRAKSSVPIILLTAKDSDVDQITGLSLGSDDYITKPFKPTLLNARVKSLLRRAEMVKPKAVDIVFGDLRFNASKYAVFCKEKELPLTQLELSCLAYMLAKGDGTASREDLLRDVWGYDIAIETRAVDETIRRIRKKLTTESSNVSVVNKWGYGYTLKEGGE